MNSYILSLTIQHISSLFLTLFFILFFKYNNSSIPRNISIILFSIYITSLLILVGFPTMYDIYFSPNINLKLFLYKNYTEYILNILLFMPFGVFIPLLSKSKINFIYTVFTGIIFSIFIELSQMFGFRATDINDIMTNTTGTVLGYFIFFILSKIFSKIYKKNFKNIKNSGLDCFFVILICIVSNFFISPIVVSFIFNFI